MTTETTVPIELINLAHDAAEQVRAALDRKACPGAWMTIAYEATVQATIEAMDKAERIANAR